jgi:hypothetical protein
MNVLPTPANSQEPLAQTAPQGPPAAVTAARALRSVGEEPSRQPQRPPVSQEQQDELISRLDRKGRPDQGLPLKGRRAVAAYSALDQADEQAYMKEVLGFEVRI